MIVSDNVQDIIKVTSAVGNSFAKNPFNVRFTIHSKQAVLKAQIESHSLESSQNPRDIINMINPDIALIIPRPISYPREE